MAGMDRYPLYYDDSENTLRERNYQSKYAGGDIGAITDRNAQPRIPSKTEDTTANDDDGAVKRYVGAGVVFASLITENLLSHPFVVLRRQCQVHNDSKRYHLVPVTLLPVIFHLHQRQGITTLWKGIGSALLVRGLSLAVEDLICKLTPWPKEISWQSSWKSMGQHILLKCTSLAIITPFYSASLVETVQSDIASEKPGIFDVFKEGMCRLVSWGAPQKGRMLPVWALVVPTVMHGLLKYFVGALAKSLARRIMRANRKHQQQLKGALSRDLPPSVSQDIEMSSTLIGIITADVVFFPLETILHRLHLQGTRTIIDNLDSGYTVMPILTSYEGPSDCYELTVLQEGVSGLYKGFGALILQFAAHIAVIKLTKFVITEVTQLLHSSPKTSRPPPEPPQTLQLHTSSSHQELRQNMTPTTAYGRSMEPRQNMTPTTAYGRSMEPRQNMTPTTAYGRTQSYQDYE